MSPANLRGRIKSQGQKNLPNALTAEHIVNVGKDTDNQQDKVYKITYRLDQTRSSLHSKL